MKTNKINGMKRELLKFLGFSAVWMGTLAFSQMSFVHADEGSGHSGGGNITEADLRYYMSKIDTYLQSDDGKAAFPEIIAYDVSHPTETFKQLIQNTHPVVQKGELKDGNGVVRDCMSYANPGNRYFVCNSDALPNKTLENQPSFYRIVLHELMVQAGIEKPLSKDVPSVYEVSSRITTNVHLETYQEWVPGKSGTIDLITNGIFCSYSYNQSKMITLDIFPDGTFELLLKKYSGSKLKRAKILSKGTTGMSLKKLIANDGSLHVSYARTLIVVDQPFEFFSDDTNDLRNMTRLTNLGNYSHFIGYMRFTNKNSQLGNGVEMVCRSN